MKITAVTVWKENLQLTRPYTIAYRTIDSVENVFLYLQLENGIGGIGAASPAKMVTGESMEMTHHILQERAEEILVGRDIRQFQSILKQIEQELPEFPAARAAIDIALYDAFAQYLDLPLGQLLGQVHQALPTSITIGIQSLEETMSDAVEKVGQGFRIIKLKTGREVYADIEVFAKLRENFGSDIKIRVDANQGYSLGDLLIFVEKTKHLDVEFIEQPFPATVLGRMDHLPETLRRKCAADESMQIPSDALKLATASKPFGIFNIKLMKCGGIRPALQIADVAQSAGIDLMWGCMDESIVSIAAALHAAYASPATRYLDLDGSLDLARDVVEGGFKLKDGMLYVTDKPGLGVSLLKEKNLP